MNIQDLGALGEVVGAIAVVVSLIYLATQIRQNTRQISMSVESARLAAFERTVESSNQAREILFTNPEIADLFLRGLADYRNLQSRDRFRCNMLFRNLLSSIQGVYIRQMTMDPNAANPDGTRKTLAALFTSPGIRQWLEEVETDWRPEFARLVEDIAATAR